MRSVRLGCRVVWGFPERLHVSPKFCSLCSRLCCLGSGAVWMVWVFETTVELTKASKEGSVHSGARPGGGAPDAIPCSLSFEVDWL